MSDPLRTDSARPLNATSEADREAKIEELLLVGLDYYFASLYEQAINIWTRALFLDRSHARARAYIERARSALAERQRQSEELLQTGMAAFHRGDGDEARRLLRAAIDSGAPPEEALALLDRLNRLTGGAGAQEPHPARSLLRAPAIARPPAPQSTQTAQLSAIALLGAATAVLLGVMVLRHVDWRSWFAPQEPRAALGVAPVTRETVLPLPRRGETALARARVLAASGRLREALAALDLIRPTDEETSAADRLRADIQRQLLALAPSPGPAPPGIEPRKGRLP
jgi:hypothetical protein